MIKEYLDDTPIPTPVLSEEGTLNRYDDYFKPKKTEKTPDDQRMMSQMMDMIETFSGEQMPKASDFQSAFSDPFDMLGDDVELLNNFKVDESARFAKVNNFLTTQLQAYLSSVNPESAGGAGTAAPSVFCYLNSAFTPSLEERLSALRDDYGADGRLVVHYALKPAWG